MAVTAGRSTIKQAGLRSLIGPVVLAVLVGALVVPARAGTEILFDPTGGGGANPATTISTSQFTWAPGNALAIGAITPGAGPVEGTTFELKYQAILGGINGTTLTNNGVSVVGQQTDTTPANGGEIITGGVATGRQLTVVADFFERITGVTSAGGQTTVTVGLASGPTNSFTIYDQAAGTAKNFAGTGFNTGTPILTGHVIPTGLEGTFSSTFTSPASGTGSPGSPVAFNQYGSDAAALAFWAATKTTSGTGSTFVPVAVDHVDPAYFLPSGPSFIEVTLPSVSAGLPFSAVEPSKFFTGTAPNLGAVNQVSGPDFQFQVQATNDFAVPEPGSIIPALTAALAIPSFLFFLRRSKTAIA